MPTRCPICGIPKEWIGIDCEDCGASNLPLTKEYAHLHIRKVTNYSKFKSITNEAAEIMAKSTREISILKLNGLTELSDEVAESLSKIKCGLLSLNSLKRLSNPSAKSLSNALCLELSLENICFAQLSDTAKESLRKFEGTLHLAPLEGEG